MRGNNIKKNTKRRKSKFNTKKQVGGVLPCVPCVAAAFNPVGAAIVVAGACAYGGLKSYKGLKKRLTKRQQTKWGAKMYKKVQGKRVKGTRNKRKKNKGKKNKRTKYKDKDKDVRHKIK